MAPNILLLFPTKMKTVLYLVVLLSLTDLISSKLNYHVDSLDDTRKALLSDTGSSKPGTSPSNSFLTTVYEIEKSVFDAQAIRSFYPQSSKRLKKIQGIIKVASKQGNIQFIRQSLGHALFTTMEIEKRGTSSRREKRSTCSICVKAMKKFMKSIKKEIGSKKFEEFIGTKNSDKATLMFAIDDTGSMWDEIQAAKDIAEYIVQYPRDNLRVDYILSPFNDPEKGRALKDKNGKVFVDKIKALRPHGGGDCPEMAFKGILEALEKDPQVNSPLYVFTDAPPKDATKDNIDYVRVRARSLGINVYFFTTIGCGKPAAVEPFKNLAEQTCGQIFELPKDSSDIAKMKKVTKNLLGGTTCSGGIGGGFFPGKKKRSTRHSIYKLLVDDTMEKIIVSVSSEKTNAKISLKNPLGAPSGKTIVSKVTLFEVNRPRPGIWRLRVPPGAGKHTYLFKGSSKTNLDFDFIFVIPRHGGSPIPISHPLIGKRAHVILIVRKVDKLQAKSLSLAIVKEDGKVINTVPVRAVGRSGTHFSATFATPSVPFKLRLRGKTRKNFDFERNSQSTVNPSHVVLRVLYARNEFTVPKSGYEFAVFFVYNTGATEVFDFKVVNTAAVKVPLHIKPKIIKRNRLAFFTVSFTATSSAVPGATDNMLVTVTGRTTKVSDSYVVSLMVA